MLALENIHVRFGGLKALSNVSLTVRQGEIHALIGPNGAGKTTLFDTISGVQRIDEGRIFFQGKDLTGQPLWTRASMGIMRTFQNIRLFNRMSVIENVMTGMHHALKANPLLSLVGGGAGRAEEAMCLARCRELLDLVGLIGVQNSIVSTLPYGHQRKVEIARALAAKPQLLLLDEPAAGMNETESLELAELLRRLCDNGLTMLVVEHDLHFLDHIASTMTVLNFGTVLARGLPSEIRSNADVITAYLGTDAARTREYASRPRR